MKKLFVIRELKPQAEDLDLYRNKSIYNIDLYTKRHLFFGS
jgi:hypothetical protein